MEGKRQSSSSSSSFTADLFGTKESPPSSSSGIFASILSPPSMGVGRNASNSEVMGSWQKQHPGNKDRINSKQGTAGTVFLEIPANAANTFIKSYNSENITSCFVFSLNNIASCTGGASCNIPNKNKSFIVQEEIAEPCHLSSSLYYGGQDIYSHSPSSRAAGSYPVFKKDGEEDDPNGNSHGASRGNWWQGSLYY
ncbi:hypothetical protein Pint_32673 [Pistacia integerrima]|uniref:Uncharacterized protein n=1 Tax=Pistacia integerrima TaxID=434235 RepID=A0ACC0XRM0_9ROSI|nr:hypothetical protein Pint_32673 [Pistacia integerrima]